jgi:hypothetical protein
VKSTASSGALPSLLGSWHHIFSATRSRGDTTIIVSMLGIHESTEQAAKKLFAWAFKNDDKVTPIGALVAPVAGTPASALDPNAH